MGAQSRSGHPLVPTKPRNGLFSALFLFLFFLFHRSSNHYLWTKIKSLSFGLLVREMRIGRNAPLFWVNVASLVHIDHWRNYTTVFITSLRRYVIASLRHNGAASHLLRLYPGENREFKKADTYSFLVHSFVGNISENLLRMFRGVAPRLKENKFYHLNSFDCELVNTWHCHDYYRVLDAVFLKNQLNRLKFHFNKNLLG